MERTRPWFFPRCTGDSGIRMVSLVGSEVRVIQHDDNRCCTHLWRCVTLPFRPTSLIATDETEGWRWIATAEGAPPSTGSPSNTPHFSYARHGANEEGLQTSFVESCCHLPNSFDDLAHDWSLSTPDHRSIRSRTIKCRLYEKISNGLYKDHDSFIGSYDQMNIVRFKNVLQNSKSCVTTRLFINKDNYSMYRRLLYNNTTYVKGFMKRHMHR